LGRLTELQETCIVKDYIATFDILAICIEGMGDEFYFEYFISGLKEAIQAHVQMHHPPTWMDACTKVIKMECALAAQSPRPNFIAKGRPT